MLPFNVLKTAQNHPLLVELKNGETYNGHLVSVDRWMNLVLRDVVMTSRDGTKFYKLPECFLKGNFVKYIRIPEDVLELMKDDFQQKKDFNQFQQQRSNPRSQGKSFKMRN